MYKYILTLLIFFNFSYSGGSFIYYAKSPTYIKGKKNKYIRKIETLHINYTHIFTSYLEQLKGYSLNEDKRLLASATSHAIDIATHNRLSHFGSGKATDIASRGSVGSFFIDRNKKYGIINGNMAEIIGYTRYDIVGNREPLSHFIHLCENFKKSPKHNAILYSNKYKKVGVAGVRTLKGIYWVIEFLN